VHVAGDRFDLPDFHSVILESSGMPLNLLERLVDIWIDEQKTAIAEEEREREREEREKEDKEKQKEQVPNGPNAGNDNQAG
jgi:hypothetical protein